MVGSSGLFDHVYVYGAVYDDEETNVHTEYVRIVYVLSPSFVCFRGPRPRPLRRIVCGSSTVNESVYSGTGT